MPSIIPFAEKEGKHFAPIVSNEPRYMISLQQEAGDNRIQTRDGVWVEPDGTQMTEKSGTKGTYAIVRFNVTGSAAQREAELFAVNTQTFQSSN